MSPSSYTPLVVDEFALLRAWQKGDDDAGHQLLRRHVDTVYHFFLNKTGPAPAEELTQSTFETCVEKREQLNESGSIRAYLLAIARRKLLQHRDEWRRRGSRYNHLTGTLEGGATSPSLAAARNEQQRLVLEGLQQLPLDFQIAVELHYWEDLSVVEIARVLDVAPGTVKSRLHRARHMLKETIENFGAAPEVRDATVKGLHTWISSLRRARAPKEGGA